MPCWNCPSGGAAETAIRIWLDFKRNLIGIGKTMAPQGDNMKRVVPCLLEHASEFSVLIDGSAPELFTGKQVVSERFYLDTGNKTMKLFCPEGAALLRVTSYEMESIYRWEEQLQPFTGDSF